MLNSYYSDFIKNFLLKSNEEIIGTMTLANQFNLEQNAITAWREQINILKAALKDLEGEIHFEFSIPRMGKRIDCLLIIEQIVFVIEFKVGETTYNRQDFDQVWDYALDLKNFHKPSHQACIVPLLVVTDAYDSYFSILTSSHNDNLYHPVRVNQFGLIAIIKQCLVSLQDGQQPIGDKYILGSYEPTPTIIEAAVRLYNDHSVEEITRSDAGATNLSKTNSVISVIINEAKQNSKKVICFVTGVPGAGKTLVGLNVATSHLDKSKGDSSVFLSGNAPLVAILQEALTRDKVKREKEKGVKVTKSSVKDSVKTFIQIIHHYRDAYLVDKSAPYDHVAIFDEAQRAWNKEQTISFMKRKKGQQDFKYSEPEYLISCLDRHPDWAVIICLVGGGQEINTGEAGISEWLSAIKHHFTHWEVAISPYLTDSEYNAQLAIQEIQNICTVHLMEELHLSVSMRSYRAEYLSQFVKELLDIDSNAIKTFKTLNNKYPLVLTRDLDVAKKWIKEKARGTERYGIVVSSQAQRLKPFAIDVKTPVNPVNWFLDGKDDVRSSYYLEDVVTEFQVQGLEVDWACLTWDGDLRFSENGWQCFSFVGTKWQNIRKEERKRYLINAYRVLLTRARQGMVIVIPQGDEQDPTRNPLYYDETFNYLKSLGLSVI